MLQTACPQFKELTAAMQEKQAARNTMILRNSSDSDLRAIEEELIRVQRIVARHRRTCPCCLANGKRIKPLSIGHPQQSFDIAS